MTINEIMAMTPEQVQRRVAELLGWTNLQLAGDTDFLIGDPPGESYTVCVPDYHTDLNDAMQLVPQGKDGCWDENFQGHLCDVLGCNSEWLGPVFVFECPDKPLAICRAFIAWKDGAK